ncbi:MAG: single-stranded-DNA-specific exonuclease RecJ [Planctomycetota bacterium]|jgi:single-stranded-DNA-specific exonuclease
MRPFQPRTPDPDVAARLARELGVHAVTAQILASRGLNDADEARRFLRPGPEQLHEPSLFLDMDQAIARISRAIREKETIAVYGDYDVDGVTSTAIVVRAFQALGAERMVPFIPDRMREGFGLNAEALLRLKDQGCTLVVTVDNGTSRADEIAAAQAAGLDVIVTDHHEQGPSLPDCPVINPKRHDSTYPFTQLAGCGVAFKLAAAVAEGMGLARGPAFKALLPDLLALVAMGTVADVVQLVDENRALVSMGLKALTATQHPGLRALLDVARCSRRPVEPSDVGYRIGPRINAAGRIGSAQQALDLILCEDPKRAAVLAKELDEGNTRRQQIEREQAEDAFTRARALIEETDPAAVVLGDASWHPGVIGIVAARVAETFHRPAAMISIEGDEARGSARSFGKVKLHEMLDQCSEHLKTHGGHAAAAGFTLDAKNLDAFAEAFAQAVARAIPSEPAPREVDAELPLEAITGPLAAELELLRPFGSGNHEPVFCAYGLRRAGRSRRTGNEERHLNFYAASAGAAFPAVAFNQGDSEGKLESPFDLAFVVRRRQGPEPVELVVRDIVPARP